MPFSTISLESPCCITTELAPCALLMWQRMIGEWCWKPHTQYMMRNGLSHLPPAHLFSPAPSRWRLPFSHGHVYSCKKTVPSESCPQKFIFLSLIMCAVLIDSPLGSLKNNIQLIFPQTTSWKWLGKFLFRFVPSPWHPTDQVQEEYLACQHVPAAHSLAAWGLQMENSAADICRIPRLIMFVKGQPWQHAPGCRHS